MVGWLVYIGVILAVSGLTGMHLGRFREAYTEMTGMMAGMTMGMLNGFVLGFASASAANSMFWGNLFGILLGLGLGIYFGRPGGLMGIMDGGMGGVMGGSMGAMLAVMIVFPEYGLFWTAVLLTVLYLFGMAGLVVLIERSAPGHAALHRLAPFFTRAMALEAEEVADEAQRSERPRGAQGARGARGARGAQRGSKSTAGGELSPLHVPDVPAQLPVQDERERKLVDYYALLGVPRSATPDDISEAYLMKMAEVEASGGDTLHERTAERLERGLEVLTDARKRAAYDLRLAEGQTSVRTGSAGSAGSAGSISNTFRDEGRDSKSADDRPDSHPPLGQKRAGSATLAATAQSDTRATRATQVTVATKATNQASKQPGPRQGNVQGKQGGQGKAAAQKQASRGAAGQQPARYAQKQRVQRPQYVRQRSLPISWVGGLAAVVILIALSWLGLGMANRMGFGAGTSSGPTQAKLGDMASTSHTGDLQLSVSLNPDPPQPGPTTFTLQVTDPAGQPVAGAQVRWSMDMTNMNMGPQNGQMTDLGSGRYQARGAFSMGGPWRISVEVSKDGQTLGSGYFNLQIHY